jgi:UDP-N-acetyl-D-mannosaminuronic acid dehydrogenase
LLDLIVKEIRDRRLRLTVLGCGYVGLPTAALFADAGFNVVALDLNSEVVKSINNEFSPINEPGLNELVSRNVKSGRLHAVSSSTKAFAQAEAIIIAVQTPIDENNKPNLSFFMGAMETVRKNLKKNMLIAVCSIVPPRTCKEKIEPLLESLSGLKADADFYLAYVPERIAPGKALEEFVESPRLVGGIGPNSTKIAAELFRTVCNNIIETEATTAEIAKVAENAFRDVNIAFANQLALICEQFGVDITRIIEFANTHPRVNIHRPGPGVGGPCLPKDPYLLINKAKLKNQNIIKTARKINDYMPKHIIELVLQALKSTGKDVKSGKTAILGTAYKNDVDDSRLSPSEPIIRELLHLGAEVTTYDPYCNESFEAKRANSLHEAVKGTDCLAIVTDHTEFKNLNLREIKALMNEKPAIVDGRRIIIDPHEAEDLGFIYYGVGFPFIKWPIRRDKQNRHPKPERNAQRTPPTLTNTQHSAYRNRKNARP